MRKLFLAFALLSAVFTFVVVRAPSSITYAVCSSASGDFQNGATICFDANTMLKCVNDQWDSTNAQTCAGGCSGDPPSAVCAGAPTSTPIPQGGGDCTIDALIDGPVSPAVVIPAGQAKCVRNVAISCANGTPSYNNCTASQGSCQASGTSASCAPGLPTATPTPIGSNGISVYAQGQLIPRPGSNCGVIRYANPAERAAAVAAGEDLTQSNDACCYSKLATAEIPDPQIDVIWVGDFISGMVSVLNTVLDQLPFIGFPSDIGLLNVAKLKAGLQSINAQKCYDGPQYAVGDPAAGNCYCMGGSFRNLSKYCDNSGSDAATCKACMETGNGIYTAIGCIKNISNIQGLVTALFNVGLGISGGFAFMCIIYAAFILQTSQGNPERLKRARDLMTSCITGLLLVIFSIFILRVIGVQILKIPGFT